MKFFIIIKYKCLIIKDNTMNNDVITFLQFVE